MQVKPLITALALAAASVSSFALTQNVGNLPAGGSFIFGDNVSGQASLLDTYVFTTSVTGITGTAFSQSVGSFTVALLNSASTVISTDTTPDTFSFSGLTAGATYSLRFTGTPSGSPAFYGGNVTAVPEPGTYAMMLAGLGALGWVSLRRRRG